MKGEGEEEEEEAKEKKKTNLTYPPPIIKKPPQPSLSPLGPSSLHRLKLPRQKPSHRIPPPFRPLTRIPPLTNDLPQPRKRRDEVPGIPP